MPPNMDGVNADQMVRRRLCYRAETDGMSPRIRTCVLKTLCWGGCALQRVESFRVYVYYCTTPTTTTITATTTTSSTTTTYYCLLLLLLLLLLPRTLLFGGCALQHVDSLLFI